MICNYQLKRWFGYVALKVKSPKKISSAWIESMTFRERRYSSVLGFQDRFCTTQNVGRRK